MDRREEIARLIWFMFNEGLSAENALSSLNDAQWNYWRGEEDGKAALACADAVLALPLSLGEEEQGLGSSSPALPTRPSGLTGAPYSDGEVLALQLKSIRMQLDNWIKFNTEERAREGLTSDRDTMIHAPPFWPSHGQLENWIKAIRGAEEIVGK